MLVGGTGGPAVQQVAGDRVTDVGQQRQRQHRPGLVLGQGDLSLPPINILQAQTHDIHRPQTRPGRQQQQRPIPKSLRGSRIRSVDQLIDAIGRQHRHRPATPSQHRGHRRRQSRAAAGILQEAAQHPQRRHHSPHAPRLVATAEKHHRSRHIRVREALDGGHTTLGQPGQHRAGYRRIQLPRCRC